MVQLSEVLKPTRPHCGNLPQVREATSKAVVATIADIVARDMSQSRCYGVYINA